MPMHYLRHPGIDKERTGNDAILPVFVEEGHELSPAYEMSGWYEADAPVEDDETAPEAADEPAPVEDPDDPAEAAADAEEPAPAHRTRRKPHQEQATDPLDPPKE